MRQLVLVVLLALAAPAWAGVWSDCVLYNRADARGEALYQAAAKDLSNTVIADLAVLNLPDSMLKLIGGDQRFVGVCRYVKPYVLPVERHCVDYNRDYRFDQVSQRWVFEPGWNTSGAGLHQCWYRAGWEERTGYWGESGTAHAGEWIAYTPPCADYRARNRRGEKQAPEPSCDGRDK